MKAKTSRVKIFRVTPETILGLLTVGSVHHFKVVENGLPADARLIGSGYDHHTNSFYFHVVSEAFDPVAEGALIPALDPVTFARL